LLSFNEFVDKNIRDDQDQNNVTHFFSKYFVNYLAFPLYKLGMTPNQTTVLFIITGLIGGLLSFFNFLIVSYFLWRLHIIIDMADGSIARATKLFSEYGDVLDKFGHHIIYPVYWIGFLFASKLIYDYPLLTLIFLALSSSQWTIKHLFKSKQNRPAASNIYKRVIANIFGIEGFLIIVIIYSYTDFFEGYYVILFMITSNLILLANKAFSLLKF